MNIKSRPVTREYASNYDRIFGKAKVERQERSAKRNTEAKRKEIQRAPK